MGIIIFHFCRTIYKLFLFHDVKWFQWPEVPQENISLKYFLLDAMKWRLFSVCQDVTANIFILVPFSFFQILSYYLYRGLFPHSSLFIISLGPCAVGHFSRMSHYPPEPSRPLNPSHPCWSLLLQPQSQQTKPTMNSPTPCCLMGPFMVLGQQSTLDIFYLPL